MFRNRERIFRLSRYEQKAKYNGMLLGKLWDVLTPVLQLCVYWFVFSVGLKMRTVDGNYSYAVWMVTGMIPWFTISGSMLGSSTAITSSSAIIHNLKIPMSIIPAKGVVSYLVEHLWMLIFLFFMLAISGVPFSWHMLEIVYYFACMVIFMLAFALLSSSLGAVVKDFGRILSPIIRLMFYLSSAIMSLDGLPQSVQTLLKINPVTYIIMGYRNALLYQVGPWDTPWHGLCFWVTTLLLVVVSSTIHMRTREHFVDML